MNTTILRRFIKIRKHDAKSFVWHLSHALQKTLTRPGGYSNTRRNALNDAFIVLKMYNPIQAKFVFLSTLNPEQAIMSRVLKFDQ